MPKGIPILASGREVNMKQITLLRVFQSRLPCFDQQVRQRRLR